MADADPVKRMDDSIGRQPEGSGIAVRSGTFRMGLDRHRPGEAPVTNRIARVLSLAYSVREHPSEHAHRAEFKGGD
jgi:hypothetical protein